MGVTAKKLGQVSIGGQGNYITTMTSDGGGYLAMAKLSATVAIGCYRGSISPVVGYIRGIGIGADNSLTYGINEYSVTNSVANLAIARLDDTHALLAYTKASVDIGVRVLTINPADLSITIGAEVTITAATSANYVSVVGLSATSGVVTFQDGGTTYGNCVALTVSGTTITLGTKTAFNAVASSYVGSSYLDATHIIIGYYSTNNVYAVVGTIAGTVITFGVISASIYNATANYMTICGVNATNAVVAWQTSGGGSAQARLITISGTTISVTGTIKNIYASIVTSTMSSCLVNTNQVIVAWLMNGGASIRATLINVNPGVDITVCLSKGVNTGTSCPVVAGLNGTPSFLMSAIYSTTASVYNWQITADDMDVAPAAGANAVTLVTGAIGGHTEVSSIYLANPTVTATIVYLYVGTGASTLELIWMESLAANTSIKYALSNCPIILESGMTLKASQTSYATVTATAFGIEEV